MPTRRVSSQQLDRRYRCLMKRLLLRMPMLLVDVVCARRARRAVLGWASELVTRALLAVKMMAMHPLQQDDSCSMKILTWFWTPTRPVLQLRIEQRTFLTPSKRKIEVNVVQSNYHIELTPR